MEKGKLYYFFDVLCGWCYGFSPVIEQAEKDYGDRLDFFPISGGMVIGEREGPIGEVAGYIKQAYKDVERATGVQFGQGFLKNILEPGKAMFSSIPPALAMAAFKAQKPDQALSFAATLQKAVYYDGMEPANFPAYAAYFEQYGLDGQEQVQQMQAESTQEDAIQEFRMTQEIGVSGFPTVIMENNGQFFLLARGFAPYEQFQAAIEKGMK